MFKLVYALLVAAIFPAAVLSFDSYPNEFVNSTYLVSKQYPTNTVVAQNTIVSWADQFAGLGPWSEFCKTNFDSKLMVEYRRYGKVRCSSDGR